MRGSPIIVWRSLLAPVLSVATFIALSFAFLAPAQGADPGQAIFDQKCKACHTIGGGRSAGPDLKGVTSRRDRGWLIRFIAAPDTMLAQGDPLAKQLAQEYGMPMPNVGVSQQDAEKIVAYLDTQSAGTGGQSTSPPVAKQNSPASAGNADIGKELFTGSIGFANGAGACISCHNVKGVGALGGGNLGKDLTPAYTSFGEGGLGSILQSAPFPIMREAYADRPLTEAEVAHLVAFLKEAGGETGQSAWSGLLPFVVLGLIGFIPAMGIFQLIWRGRLNGVRQSLGKGGSK